MPRGCRSSSPRPARSSKPSPAHTTTVWSAWRLRRRKASRSTRSCSLAESESTADAVPHHIIIDRCYIHGDSRLGGRRGVALNASHTAVVDSYLSDFKERSVDAQAIAGWNAPGPFRIARNYLEASGENVMFGGADPRIPDLVPSDIEVVRNHMAKPLRWKKDDPSFEGTEWSVKNLFELKNARRVLVDGNLFEYNWPHAQNGFAILFTVRNQDGGAPWSVVEDVTFSNNLVRHVSAGINVLGRDDNHPSQQTRRIAIRNNVFLDVGGRWGNGRLFQLLNGTSGIVIDHNTAMQTGSVLFADGEPHTKFVFQNNVIPHNEHGITGSGTGPGNASLQRYFPGAVVRRNVIVGGMPGSYPRDNFFPHSLNDIGLRGAGPRPDAQARARRSPPRRPTAPIPAPTSTPWSRRLAAWPPRSCSPPAASAIAVEPPVRTSLGGVGRCGSTSAQPPLSSGFRPRCSSTSTSAIR